MKRWRSENELTLKINIEYQIELNKYVLREMLQVWMKGKKSQEWKYKGKNNIFNGKWIKCGNFDHKSIDWWRREDNTDKRTINWKQRRSDQENVELDTSNKIEVLLCSYYMLLPCDMKILTYNNVCIANTLVSIYTTPN